MSASSSGGLAGGPAASNPVEITIDVSYPATSAPSPTVSFDNAAVYFEPTDTLSILLFQSNVQGGTLNVLQSDVILGADQGYSGAQHLETKVMMTDPSDTALTGSAEISNGIKLTISVNRQTAVQLRQGSFSLPLT
jgi:hypothetical protein